MINLATTTSEALDENFLHLLNLVYTVQDTIPPLV